MQKKIYSLLLVPCSLALCSVLVFLMSCGDDKDDSPPPPPPSSSSSFQHPPSKNDPRVHMIGIDTLFSSNWSLTVIGDVEYRKTFGMDNTEISSILIKMRNMKTDELTPIQCSASYWGENFTLSDGQQQGNGPNFGQACKFKGRYRIYIYVYLSDNLDTIAKIDSLEFEKSHPDCRDNYTLKFEYPRGGGSVELEPNQEKYAKGDKVKLIPKPANGYAFWNWYIDHEYKSENPYLLEITRDEEIKATFIESRDFTKVSGPSDINKGGSILNGAVTFDGRNFTALGNAKIIEYFQLPEKEIDDPRNSETFDVSMIPSDKVSKTHQFKPALGPREDGITYVADTYFIVESAGNKYLLLGERRGVVCYTDCVSLTIWKY